MNLRAQSRHIKCTHSTSDEQRGGLLGSQEVTTSIPEHTEQGWGLCPLILDVSVKDLINSYFWISYHSTANPKPLESTVYLESRRTSGCLTAINSQEIFILTISGKVSLILPVRFWPFGVSQHLPLWRLETLFLWRLGLFPSHKRQRLFLVECWTYPGHEKMKIDGKYWLNSSDGKLLEDEPYLLLFCRYAYSWSP